MTEAAWLKEWRINQLINGLLGADTSKDLEPLASVGVFGREISDREPNRLAREWAKNNPNAEGFIISPYGTGGYRFYHVSQGKAINSSASTELGSIRNHQPRHPRFLKQSEVEDLFDGC